MQGRSFKIGCPIGRDKLRLVKVRHYNLAGEVRDGSLICHKAIARDLIEIFQELFQARYPIERIMPIDHYDGNDDRSMEANNSSAFNHRRVAGSTRLSLHSYGLAVDINPRYNPYIGRNGTKVRPAVSRPYTDRHRNFSYKIEANDFCVRLFKQHGFKWGGDWRTVKDYQHFEKKLAP